MRRFWRTFWNLIDSDSVRPFEFVYYVPLLAFGVVAIAAAVVLSFEGFPSAALAILWVWVQVPATLSAMVGLYLRGGGTPVAQMSALLLFRDWLGLGMQLGGHVCMVAVLLAFELVAGSIVALGPAGIAVGVLGVLIWWIILFAMAAISSYVIGCTLLALQVVRKIWRGIQLRRTLVSG